MSYMSDDLKNLGKNLKAMVNSQKLNALKAGQKVAISLGAKETKISENRYLDVTFDKREESGGVIDLKKGFESGKSVRHKRKGGWYTIVPISYKTSDMSNSTYKQARDLINESSKTTYIDILYGGEALSDDSLTEFGITTQVHGGNITRTNEGVNRGVYFAFRTVSDKSAADSWLLLKDSAKAHEEDTIKLKQIGNAIQTTLMSYQEEI